MSVIDRYNALVISRDNFKRDLKNDLAEHLQYTETILKHEKFQRVFFAVRAECVKVIRDKYETIQNLALEDIVTDADYKFWVHIISRRNKPNVDLEIKKLVNGIDRFVDIDDGGSGVEAVLRIASLVSILALSDRRPFLFLDEEITAISKKHGDSDYRGNTLFWFKEISKQFGIQNLMITHEKEIEQFADRVFEIELDKETGISNVTQYDK